MEKDGQLRQILTAKALKEHLKEWNESPLTTPIGYILSLEGADSLIDISYLETAYNYGLRAIGLSHFGKGRYALGHDCDGKLSDIGKDLLNEVNRLGIILDVTHLSEPSFWEVMNSYEGPVWASHHNCRSLVEDPRQLSDKQIKALIDRGSVIGSAFDTWMLTLADDSNRGKVVTTYNMVFAIGFAIGPAVIGLTGLEGSIPFITIALISFIVIIPILTVKVEAPDLSDHKPISVLLAVIAAPTIFGAAILMGLEDVMFVSFFPIYLIKSGFGYETALNYVTISLAGGVPISCNCIFASVTLLYRIKFITRLTLYVE